MSEKHGLFVFPPEKTLTWKGIVRLANHVAGKYRLSGDMKFRPQKSCGFGCSAYSSETEVKSSGGHAIAFGNIRFSSRFAAGDVSPSPAEKSEEKRMFSQATLLACVAGAWR